MQFGCQHLDYGLDHDWRGDESIDRLVKLTEFPLAHLLNLQRKNNSPRRNQVNPTQICPPQITHQSSNRKLRTLIAWSPRQIQIPRHTRNQNQTLVRHSRFREIVEREFGGVGGAHVIGADNLEIWFGGVVRVFEDEERVTADNAGVGDDDVDIMVWGVCHGGFEDGQLVRPRTDVT